MNDLHNFVSVALHTSVGEDDYSHDKLSQLKVVGSGFGPLIYHLKKDSDFVSFTKFCEDVWSSLQETPQLPSLLVSITQLNKYFCSELIRLTSSVKDYSRKLFYPSYKSVD